MEKKQINYEEQEETIITPDDSKESTELYQIQKNKKDEVAKENDR